VTKTAVAVAKVDAAGRRPQILLAEDDDELRALLGWRLRRDGFEVTECEDGLAVLRQLGICGFPEEEASFDVIVSDVRMPDLSGLDLLEGLHDGGPPIILITAFGSDALHGHAERLGAAAVLDKPLDLDEFVAVVEEVTWRLPRPGDRAALRWQDATR
jgi:DNA-binding response OmpR family regulator